MIIPNENFDNPLQKFWQSLILQSLMTILTISNLTIPNDNLDNKMNNWHYDMTDIRSWRMKSTTKQQHNNNKRRDLETTSSSYATRRLKITFSIEKRPTEVKFDQPKTLDNWSRDQLRSSTGWQEKMDLPLTNLTPL